MAAKSPVTPLEQLQFEDDLAMRNTILDIPQNIFYFRPIFQIDANKWIQRPQLFRIKMLIETPAYLTPYIKGTAFGDTQLLDLLILYDDEKMRWGAGAIAILPTAGNLSTGQGKWQLGPAFGFDWKLNRHWQLSLLVQNPYSLCGPKYTPYVKAVFFQPFLSYHFGKGNYIISNAQWTFQYNPKKVEIPLNIGIGKVFPYLGVKLDASVQSEWMAYQSATSSVPRWTLKFSLNVIR